MNAWPRTLFVTPAAFNHLTGGGITFSNLFRTCPTDRLATVHCDPVPTTEDVCRNFYPLTDAELQLVPPLDWVAALSGRQGASALQTSDRPAQSKAERTGPSLRQRVQSLFFQAELPRRGVLSARLEAWIAAFKPQVIYTILGSNGMMDLVDAIRVRFDLPLVIHMMDDWPSHAHRHGLFAPALRRGMNQRLSRLMHAASVRIAICDAMADAYRKRWGLNFKAIHNAVDTAKWAGVQRAHAVCGQPARLLYVGSVAPFAQQDALIDVCHAVAGLSARGIPVTLDIASPSYQISGIRHLLEVSPAVRVVPPIEDDAVFYRTIAEADGLVLPVNFDGESVRFIRFSMPTKVPAYLFSGTPILLYGPPEVAQVQYAQQASWGVAVTRQDPDALESGLLRLVRDTGLREQLSQTGRSLAKSRHDLPAVRETFRQSLCEATS